MAMNWINVEDSNFAKTGLSVHFLNNHFVCFRGAEAGLKIDAADITFLNPPPRYERIDATPATVEAQHDWMDGSFIAMVMEFFGRFSKRKKKTRKIIVKFKEDRFLIGKTDLETFFTIQNAWLDRR